MKKRVYLVNMKTDYQKFKELLKTFTGNESILLHSCCAPCSSYVISLLSEYANITVYYYNPNIVPKEEYEKRKNEQIRFINEYNGKHNIDFIDGDYDVSSITKFKSGTPFIKEGGEHCYKCYYYRMEKTAIYAKENNYDYFTTTLSVSPYKKSDYINEIGSILSEKYDIKYLYSNFKKENGYKESIRLSKEYNLYRQNYCGCSYSMKGINDHEQ